MNEFERSNLIIPVEKVPVAAFQAIYHKLTKRTDRLQKRYRGGYTIHKYDIESLADRLSQAIRQYQIKGESITFVSALKEYQVQEVNGLDKFKFLNLAALPVETVIFRLSLDFLIILPVEIKEAEDIPQRYRVSVSIYQKDEDVMHAISSFEGKDIRDIEHDIETSVDYADFSVGRTIFSVVEEWINGLPNSDKGGAALKRTRKRSAVIGHLPFVFLISSLVGAAFFDASALSTGLTPMRYLLLSLTVTSLFVGIGVWLSERIAKIMSALLPRTHLRLTRGDEALFERVEGARRKKKQQMVFFAVTVLLAFALNVFASYISSALFG